MHAITDMLRNWVAPYFTQPEQPPTDPVENAQSETVNSTSEQVAPAQEAAAPEVTADEPAKAKRTPCDHQKMELSELLGLFHKESDIDAETRVRAIYSKVKGTQNKQQECTQLYNLFSDPATIASDGTLTLLQNDTAQSQLQKAKALGITIAEGKNNFTKEERDHILRQIERKTADVDVDLKIQMHEVTEATKRHDLETQMFKSMEDKQDRAKERAIRAISGG